MVALSGVLLAVGVVAVFLVRVRHRDMTVRQKAARLVLPLVAVVAWSVALALPADRSARDGPLLLCTFAVGTALTVATRKLRPAPGTV